MKEYEVLFILKPQLSEEERQQVLDAFQGWITKTKGEILMFEQIGLRDLAYEIEDQNKGFYVQCQFKGGNETLDEIAKRTHVEERIIRHLLVDLASTSGKKMQIEK